MASRKKSPRAITVECYGCTSNSLDDECIARVVFRPEVPSGFVVRFFACMDPIVDKDIFRSTDNLTWRTAAHTLLALDECEVNPEGCDTYATGVEGYACGILLGCWSREISADCLIGAFASTDAQLRQHWKWAVKRHTGQDCSKAGLSDQSTRLKRYFGRLEIIGDLINRGGFGDLSVTEIALSIGCAVDDPDAWPEFIAQLKAHVGSAGIQREIEENATEYALTASLLNKLSSYPAPNRPDLVTRMLFSWTVTSQKPRGDEKYQGFRVSSIWPFLAWLIGVDTEEKLRAFSAAHPNEHTAFLVWLELQRMDLADRLADPQRGGGGAIGRAIGRSAAMHQLHFCETILNAARSA